MPDELPTDLQGVIAYAASLAEVVSQLQKNPPLAFHVHNGYDMNKVSWVDIDQKTLYLAHTVPSVDAATAGYYSTFFIAPAIMTLQSVREVHATAGTAGGSVTLQVEKLTSTTAPGSGTNMLGTALSLKATANSVQTASLTTTLANRGLAIGDRVALKTSGTLTSVANVTVLLELTF